MQNIIKIIKISKPLHRTFLVVALLIVTSSILELITPVISKFIVDEIVGELADKSGNLTRLEILIGIAFAASIASLILTTFSDRLGDFLAGRLRQFLTEKFYDKVLSLPQSYFDSEISGKIVNQLNRGIQVIQDFTNTSTNFILPAILQSLFTIVILAYFSVPIAIFTFMLFPVYIALSYYSTKKWGEREVEKNKIEDITRGRISEVIQNIPLVKSFNAQLQEFKFVLANLVQINKIYDKQSVTYHVFDFFRGLSLNIVLLLVNIVVFYDTFRGALSIGEMVLILQLVGAARRPLFAMSFILSRIQQAESGSKEYFEILSIESGEHYNKKFSTVKIKNPTIRFSNVEFSYIHSEKVLDGVSFEIGKRETVALVGHSGAGKTTIINLILKFYNPTTGSIFLNHKNYKNLSHQFVRNNIALVFQESELFSSTIRDNVLYGNLQATDKDVVAALKLANAYEFVTKLPKGLDSEVGERGVRLSGGQKQRIQIARAIIKDAPILILDEATSSLDAKSEKEVQDGLENLMRDKLVIIIAHRFSTIQNANHIIVIGNGRIVEEGTPASLVKKPGIYSELLNYQIEGNRKLLEKFEIY